MRLRSRIVALLLLTLSAISLVILLNDERSFDHRALWNSKNIHTYQMTIDALALPAPRVGIIITVVNGEIVNMSIIACDNPSEHYPARDCDPIQRYYSYLGHYTVNHLFDMADTCIASTQASLTACPVAASIERISTTDDLITIANACQSYLQPFDSLCTVEYDPDYGFPNRIAHYMPQLMDGYSDIQARDLHVIEPTPES